MLNKDLENKQILGPVYVVFSGLAFALMGALIKLMSEDLSSEVIVFFRAFWGMVFLLPILIKEKVNIRTSIPHMHFIRGLFGFGAMFTFFHSISLIPLSQAVLLSYTTPLFAPLIALIWLREKLSFLVGLALAAGFSGVIFILKPDTAGIIEVGSWIALSSGFMAAMALTTIRKISVSEPMLRIVFYHTFFSLIASLILVIPQWVMPNTEQMLVLLAIGSLATIGQMFITKGYTYAPVAKAGPFMYTTVVFSALFGVVFWSEVFDIWNLVGTLLVIVGGIIALRIKGV